MAIKIKFSNGHIKLSELKGKMENFHSLSTLPNCNPICVQNRKREGSICKKCYSHKAVAYRKNLHTMLLENYMYLSEKLIPENETPEFNYQFFRFESHGELINNNHLTNIVQIIECNPRCKFAIYTKNYALTENYFKTVKKPENLILIYSSLYVNTRLDIKDFKFADKIFTVYTDETKEKIINCNKRCWDCKKCYTKNRTQYINEFEKAIKTRKKHK